MRLLSGTELAGFIKERQAKQVRALRQAEHVTPKLAIVQTSDNPVIDTYVRMKQKYGADILVEVEKHMVSSEELLRVIDSLNDDDSVHGIIVQLPLADTSQTDEAVQCVVPHKDVDGLGSQEVFTPATPMAIDWLLAGYNVSLKDRKIAIIGKGRLVGAPLFDLWRTAGHTVTVYDRSSTDIKSELLAADIVVTAAGVPGLLTSDMVKPKATVVDAATSAEHGKIVGDADESLRSRDDLTITPEKGGVGPLTVCALFDNVIRSARIAVENNQR